jgi:hypothetical protein
MERKLIFAALAFGLMASSVTPAHSATAISDNDKLFVQLTMLTLFATKTCGAKEIKGGTLRYADSAGVDFDKVSNAIGAAYNAWFGSSYERRDLIPGVSVEVSNILDATMAASKDKPKLCRTLLEGLKDKGTIE